MSQCEPPAKSSKKGVIIIPINISAKKKRRLYIRTHGLVRASKGLIMLDKNTKLVMVPPPRPVNVHIRHKKKE